MNNIEDKIQEASETGFLLLNNLGLIEIPKEIFNLNNLEILILSNDEFHGKRFNKISVIPDKIKELKNLKILDLRKNQIKEITLNLVECDQLQNLEAALETVKTKKEEAINNQYYELAADMRELVSILNLRYERNQKDWGVILDDNPLETPPMKIVKKGFGAIRKYFEIN